MTPSWTDYIAAVFVSAAAAHVPVVRREAKGEEAFTVAASIFGSNFGAIFEPRG